MAQTRCGVYGFSFRVLSAKNSPKPPSPARAALCARAIRLPSQSYLKAKTSEFLFEGQLGMGSQWCRGLRDCWILKTYPGIKWHRVYIVFKDRSTGKSC